MSLREKLRQAPQADVNALVSTYGVLNNPFPTSSQTSNHPHYPLEEDEEAENRLLAFFREGLSEVLVVLGTQGVGKTNFLNHLEQQILEANEGSDDYYVVRYMADPEPTFDSTIRTILQELGPRHLRKVAKAVATDAASLGGVKSFDLRQALLALSKDPKDDDLNQLAMDWLLGFRLLNAHRQQLGVSFRLDTVESRTGVLRDYVLLSVKLGLLKGVILLLDELEKLAGVLGPSSVVRYLSAMRAIIDALPKHLFMVIAITPDAMRRYSSALPAFRSRLENRILLSPLIDLKEARQLAAFYMDKGKEAAKQAAPRRIGTEELVTAAELKTAFEDALKESQRRGDEGVRQREFLNALHRIAEEKIQELV